MTERVLEIEQRLRSAFTALELPPVPPTLAAGLDNLTRASSMSGVRAKTSPLRLAPVGAALALVVTVALLAGLMSGRAPAASPGGTGAAQTVSPNATSGAPGPVTMTRWGLMFDVPPGWAVADTPVDEHYILIQGYIGNGSFAVPCTAITAPPGQSFPVGFTCHDVWNVPPGTAAIEVTQLVGLAAFGGIGPGSSDAAPTIVGGLPAIGPRSFALPADEHATVTLNWTLSSPAAPGNRAYGLTARFTGPDLATLQGEVLGVVNSITYAPSP